MTDWHRIFGLMLIDLFTGTPFKLYAVTTRLPKKLFSKISPTQIQKGVYTINWGTDQIWIIVLSQIAKTKVNAFWCLISSNKQLIEWGIENYEQHTQQMSTVIKRLVDLYTQEGIKVSYTFEDFHRDMAKEYVHLLPPEERLLGLKPEERLLGLKPEERLFGLKPEERLAGLSEEQIRAYLERLQHSKDCNIN